MAGQQELLEHMDLQHAESTAEGDLLLRGNALVAEHHDVMIQVRAMDAGKVLIVDGPRQVQADDFGTDGATERADVEGLRRDVRGAWESRCCRHKSLPRTARSRARASIKKLTEVPCWFVSCGAPIGRQVRRRMTL